MTLRAGPSALTDRELVFAARQGSAGALGALLERHRPGLTARALRLLGCRSDAEDAVQETCLAAMRHLNTVRDPDAVGAWLHTVLRRTCLQQRRRVRVERTTDALLNMESDAASPEAHLDELELRDWIWASLQALPETLRVTAMLRYFGSYPSYEEVAAILGIPVGTVRSRLSEARLKLADALLASAGLVGDSSRDTARAREHLWSEAVRDIYRRGDSTPFVSRFHDDVVVGWPSGKLVRGRRHLADEIEGDLDVGVRLEPARVISADGITVVEGRLINPPESPDHCPPGIAFVVFGRHDRGARIQLYIAPRPPRPPHD